MSKSIQEWLDSHGTLSTSRGTILLYTLEGNLLRKIFIPHWKIFVAFISPLLARILRFQFTNVIRLQNHGIIYAFFDKSLFIINSCCASIQVIKLGFRVLRGGVALLEDDSIYFGTYSSMKDRSNSNHIYQLHPGNQSLDIVHTFPPGRVRHIHGVYYVRQLKRLFVLTGDLPHESFIISFSPDFLDFEILGTGDESWRAVSLTYNDGSIFYASDAEFQDNFIYSFDLATRQRHILSAVNGPVYYCKYFNNTHYFASVVEDCQVSILEKLYCIVFIVPLWKSIHLILKIIFPSFGVRQGTSFLHGQVGFLRQALKLLALLFLILARIACPGVCFCLFLFSFLFLTFLFVFY